MRINLIIIFFVISIKLVSGQDCNIPENLKQEIQTIENSGIKFYESGNLNQSAHQFAKAGYIYWNNNCLNQAIQSYNQALIYYSKINNKNATLTINSYLGTIYTDLGNYVKALDCYEISLKTARSLTDELNIASQLINTANALILLNNITEANKRLAEATEIANRKNNKKLLRTCYGLLADNYKKTGNTQASFEYYNFFLSFDKMIKEDEMKEIQAKSELEIARALTEKKTKELELSLKNYKLRAAQDSLLQSEKQNQNQKNTIELLEKDQILKDLVLKQQDDKIQRDIIIRRTIISILLLGLFFFVILILQVRKIRKKNILLNVQNKEIAEQKQILVEQAKILDLQNKELEKLSIVASKTNNAVIIADSQGEFEWVNDAFTNMTGYTLEEYMNQIGTNLFVTSSFPDLYSAFKECMDNKEAVVFTSRKINRFGQEIWTQTSITPIFNENNDLVKIIALESDITGVKKTEQKLKDSIVYASKIQSAILTPPEIFRTIFTDYFIMFRPKDVVSGDFYWATRIKRFTIIAVADCTGHGVPGALMSILGISFLNDILKKEYIDSPAKALNELRDYIKNSLWQTADKDDRREGMDIALCVFDPLKKEIEFAGAFNPLYILRNNDFVEIKGDKMPVGSYRKERDFTNQKIEVSENDIFYLFTDGYVDQFGGEKGEKFKTLRFKKILSEISSFPMLEQAVFLEHKFLEWKGNHSQMDDVLVVGFKPDFACAE